MNTYQSEREDNMIQLKNELKSMIQEKVEAHRAAVTAGTKTQPDMTVSKLHIKTIMKA